MGAIGVGTLNLSSAMSNLRVAEEEASPPSTTGGFPSEPEFFVKLLGFKQGLTFIQIYCHQIWDRHREMIQALKDEYKSSEDENRIPLKDQQVEIDVIAKLNEFYIRARIMSIDVAKKVVTVWDVDEGLEYSVTGSDIFTVLPRFGPWCIPFRVLRVSLEGLAILKALDDEQSKRLMEEIEYKGIFFANLIGNITSLPTVNLIDSHGHNVKDVILSRLEKICEVPIPELNVKTRTFVSFFDINACIWYQMGNAKLLDYITDAHTQLKERMTQGPIDELKANVREKLNDRNEVFSAPFTYDDIEEFYRVKVIKKIDDQKVIVYFMDYGNSERVNIDDLVLTRCLDDCLPYISPQARKARLCMLESVELDSMDMFVNNSRQSNLIVLDKSGSVPVVDVFVDVETEQKSLIDVLLAVDGAKKLSAARMPISPKTVDQGIDSPPHPHAWLQP